MQVPESVPGVPCEVLQPSLAWSDKDAYGSTLTQLAEMFVRNFATFADGEKYVGADTASRIVQGGPQLPYTVSLAQTQQPAGSQQQCAAVKAVPGCVAAAPAGPAAVH